GGGVTGGGSGGGVTGGGSGGGAMGGGSGGGVTGGGSGGGVTGGGSGGGVTGGGSGGGGMTGGGAGGGATGGGGGTSSNTAAQITAVRSAADLAPGSVSLPVQGALVTFVKPLAPDAGPTTDPAGFIVQAGNTGPALFVAVEASTLAVSAGDLVDFTVTGVGKNAGLRVATTLSGFVKRSSSNPVSGLAQNASSVDFAQVSALDDREVELLSMNGSLVGDMAFAGGGYLSASFTTAGTTDSTVMKLRLPAALADAEGLSTGCSVQLTASPLWRFNAQAQPSAFTSSALAGSTCPAPQLVSAVATSLTAVRATFTRPMNPFTVTTSSMTIGGLSVTQATQLSPSTFSFTTSAQTGGTSYTLTAATSVADVRGTPISASARTATFTGYQAPTSGIVINEVDYDNVGTDSAEFIELYNPTASAQTLVGRSLVLINGGSNPGPAYTTIDLTSVGSLAAGEYLVVASAATLAALPGTVKKLAVTPATDLIQNGAPDALALIDSASSVILDSLSYEGGTNWASPAGTISVQEGASSTAALADSNTSNVSIGRAPNSLDTNNNVPDFTINAAPTPGAMNVGP
ncbi:MAG: lamin tail domain-containing protein, partial [Archangium sp.]|nr:lamin tail domain-containing protein [Archangium sp.]